jgi:hypothetical protein
MDWLGTPDQGAVSSPLRPLGRNGEEIELTGEAAVRGDGHRRRRSCSERVHVVAESHSTGWG